MNFEEINEVIRGRVLLKPNRVRSLYDEASRVASLPGEFWECGVFTGGSAKMLAEIIRSKPPIFTHLRLFDTFSGFPSVSGKDNPRSKVGMFSETSVEDVMKFVNAKFAVAYPGTIPDTFAGLEECRIAFAHVDVDLYEPTKAALAFILPRMVEGGTVVIDDYGDWHYPGVAAAVDEPAFDEFRQSQRFHHFGKHDNQLVIYR